MRQPLMSRGLMNLTLKYFILTLLAMVVPLLSRASATNSLPQGSHDGADQSQHSPACWAFGFAYDPDNLNAKVRVRVLSDGREVAQATANGPRQDYSGVCPGGNCGFEIYLWDRITHGQVHTITVQAQDAQTRRWVNLSNTPRQLKCFTFELKVLNLDKGTVTPIFTGLLDYGFVPSWSPSGDKIAFADWSFSNPQHPVRGDWTSAGLHVVDLATCQTQIVEGAEDSAPAWSPDGQTIAFADWSGINLIPASGGVRQLLRAGATQPDWSPDGSRIVFYQESDSSVRTIDVSTGAETFVTSFVAPGPTYNWAYPTWSPDGRGIAFNNDAGDIFKIAVDAQANPIGMPVHVTANPRQEADACWSADSRNLFFHSEVSISADPLSEHFDLWAVSASGGRPIRLTDITGQGVNVGCWRKGNRIAYAGINNGSGGESCRPKR